MEIIFLVDFDRDTREHVTFGSTMKNFEVRGNFCQFTAVLRQASDEAYMKGRVRRVVFIYVRTRRLVSCMFISPFGFVLLFPPPTVVRRDVRLV